MREKEYLLSVKHKNGAVLSISINTDRLSRMVQVNYCGIDTGKRYEKIGNASRYIRTFARGNWGDDAVEWRYGAARFIPVTGCDERNKAIVRDSLR